MKAAGRKENKDKNTMPNNNSHSSEARNRERKLEQHKRTIIKTRGHHSRTTNGLLITKHENRPNRGVGGNELELQF
jgi:hypothetical protein